MENFWKCSFVLRFFRRLEQSCCYFLSYLGLAVTLCWIPDLCHKPAQSSVKSKFDVRKQKNTLYPFLTKEP